MRMSTDEFKRLHAIISKRVDAFILELEQLGWARSSALNVLAYHSIYLQWRQQYDHDIADMVARLRTEWVD